MAVRKLNSLKEEMDSSGSARKRIDVVFVGQNQPCKQSMMSWLETQRPTVEDSNTRAEHLERSIKRKIFG